MENEKIIGNILNFLQDGGPQINNYNSDHCIVGQDVKTIDEPEGRKLDEDDGIDSTDGNVKKGGGMIFKSNHGRYSHNDTINSTSWWKPWTSKLLVPETNENLTSNKCTQTESLAMDVCDHVFGISFWKKLKKEICESTLLLDPSKHLRIPSVKHLGGRMDHAIFIDRDFRQQSTFAKSFPQLHHFIDHVQSTIIRQLSQGFDNKNTNNIDNKNENNKVTVNIDKTQTSVQLASYKGDSTSGYVRHCDVSGKCCPKSFDNHNNMNTNSNSKSQRIITAVYYLTELDWDEIEDGGCLRVFYPDGERYWDVPPLADRLVLFRSDLVEHQVLPSHKRERLALTIWIYGHITEHNREHDNIQSQIHSHGNLKLYNVVDNNEYLNSYKNLPPLPKYNPSLQNLIADPATIATPSNNKDGLDINTNNTDAAPNSEVLDSKIFVSIPAYRDSETYPTVCSLIANAANPSRVYIGIVWQVDETIDAASCFYETPLPILSKNTDNDGSHSWNPDTNLRTIMLRHTNATGPCYARYLAQSLHRSEKFILQIDSHMRFRPNWDTYLIHLLLSHYKNNTKEQEKIVISTYPPSYSIDDKKNKKSFYYDVKGTVLLPHKFDSDGMLRQIGRSIDNGKDDDNVDLTKEDLIEHNRTKYKHHLFAAGFNFSFANVITKCPYDGQLHHLFFGEEISMAVRLFTHGYDIYSPPQTVCYHLWSREHRPATFQEDTQRRSTLDNYNNKSDWKIARLLSLNKVCEQLNEKRTGDYHKYGLGTVRSVSDFATRLGVDFKKRVILDNSSQCFGKFNDKMLMTTDEDNQIYHQENSLSKEASLLTQSLLNHIS